MTGSTAGPVVLVTGAAGNLGRSVAAALADGYRIVGLERQARGSGKNGGAGSTYPILAMDLGSDGFTVISARARSVSAGRWAKNASMRLAPAGSSPAMPTRQRRRLVTCRVRSASVRKPAACSTPTSRAGSQRSTASQMRGCGGGIARKVSMAAGATLASFRSDGLDAASVAARSACARPVGKATSCRFTRPITERANAPVVWRSDK